MIKRIIPFFKLVRYNNLILIAIMQFVLRYGFLKMQNISLALSDFSFCILLCSTILIAAAGYVINDIFDQDTDFINKEHAVIINRSISEKDAYTFYFVLNVTGVFLGFCVANIIGKPNFAVLFIMIASSLYFYASTLKQTFLFGNLLVSFLSFIGVMLVPIFDLYPIVNNLNKIQIVVFLKIILDYAIFAFVVSLIREIVKDAQDLKGDLVEQMRTMPIVLGLFTTKIVLISIGLLFTFLMIWYAYIYFFENQLYYATVFAIIFVITPFLLSLFTVGLASNTNDFKKASDLLKLVMFFGMISLLIATHNIRYNA